MQPEMPTPHQRPARPDPAGLAAGDQPAVSWERIRDYCPGLHVSDAVVDLDGDASTRERVYLDSSATTLMPRAVYQGLGAYLEQASANSHTRVHRAGRATTLLI